MNISINNMSGSSQNVSSLISQLISKRSQSMNSLLDQKSSIESMLSQLQGGGLGSGSLDSSYSSQISSLQDTIDRLNRQYSVNSNKITTINSLKNSYNSTVSSLQRYLDSLKNPNSSGGDLDIFLDGNKGSSNGNVGVIINDKNTNIQQVDLTVTQLATTSVLKSDKLTGGSVNLNTKLTDLFAGEYDSVKNSVKTTRDDLKSNMKMSELGVTSGSFSIGGTTINIDADNDTVGSVMTKLQNAGYDAKIETTGYDDSGNAIGQLVITGTGGKSLAITNQTTNFASLAGLTVSTGNFTINGQSFNVTSSSTVGSLINEINYATADGVGAKLENGQLVFVASKTGEVEINIGKGTSNFTNAIGFTVGGVMNKDNLVMGTDGSYVTLTGQNTNVKLSDSVSGGKFTAGSFSITHNKIDSNGTVLNEMVTTRIDVTSSDTVSTIIDKIKSQTAFTYTDKDGKTVNGGLTAEVVDGKFRIMQKEKGVDYKISVEAGSSTFTNYVGLTSSVSSGTAVSGSSSTLTGINNVTSSMTFNAGAFKISASSANNSGVMETKTIDVAQGESLASVINKINNSGLSVTASIQDNKLVLTHKNYGENFKIEVEAGSTDFTNKVGFTRATSVGTSNNGTSSYVLGTATGMTNTTGGFTNGSFVIKTNALSADGKTADSKMLSATIEVTSSDTLESVMQKIKDANIGLSAFNQGGQLMIYQVNGGEGFDIVVEAGDTNFTQKTGLTNSVSVGVSSTASSSYVLGTKTAPNSGFSAGSFTISTNKLSADGKTADSQMLTATIDVTASDTRESIAQKITDAGIGLTATITSEGKIKIEQNNAGSGFDIKIQAGATDFTDKAGLTTTVTNNGVLSPGRDVNQYTTLTGTNAVTGSSSVTAGTFKINGVTIDLSAGTLDSAIATINSFSAQTGVNAAIKDGKLVLQSNVTGADTNIYVEDGTSNIGSMSGLISTSSMGGSAVLGQVGSKTTLTGSNNVANDTIISSGTLKINGFDVILSGGTLADAVTKINQSSAETGVTAEIKNNKLVLTNVKTGASGILVEEGSSNIARITGIAAYQTKAGTEEIKGQTKTALIASKTGLTGNEMISSSSIILNGKKISFSGTVNNAITEINKLTGTTGVKALIDEQGRFTLVNEAAGSKSIGLTFESGDFGKVIGAVSSNVSGGTTVTTPGGSYVQGGNGGLTNGSGIIGGGSIVIGNGNKPNIGNNGTVTGSNEISSAMILSEADAIAQGYTVIKTAADFSKLSGSSGKFVLMDDIDVTGMQLGFNFSGILEGNGFTVSGGNTSLFGTVSNASINNLIISKFSMGGRDTGIFAQTISNSNVSNILIKDSTFSYSNGTSTSNNSAFAHTVSGMSTTIKNITITSNVNIYTSTGQASAFINTGTNLASGAISNVISKATLSGSSVVGNKLYNFTTAYSVTNSAYQGKVNGTQATVGTVNEATQGYKYGSRTVVSSGTTSINGVEVSYASDDIAHAINEINKKSSETGVVASIVNNKVVLKNVDGSKRDIKVIDGTGNFASVTGTDTRTVGSSGIHMSESEAISKGYTVVKTAQEFMNAVSGGGTKKVMLMGDIDFTGVAYDTVASFTGELNGNGYVVKNLTIDSGDDYVGLFNSVTDATIKNIGFDQIHVNGTNSVGAGLIAGTADNLTVDNVAVQGGSVSGAGTVGGLVGYTSDVTITNTGIIGFDFEGSNIAGGLVGDAYGNVNISDSMLFYGMTSSGSTGMAGGFIGQYGGNSLTIRDSYNASGSNSTNFGGVTGNSRGSYPLGDISFSNVGMVNSKATGSSEIALEGVYQMDNFQDFSAPNFSSEYLGVSLWVPTKILDTFDYLKEKEEQTYENSGTDVFAKVDLTGLTTIGQVIDKINGMNAGVTASLENGKFTITRNDGSKETMWIGYDGEGNFGGVTGLEDYTVGTANGFSTKPGSDTNTNSNTSTTLTSGRSQASVLKSTSAQTIAITKNGVSKNVSLAANSNLESMVNAINAANAGVTARLVKDTGTTSNYFVEIKSTTTGSDTISISGSDRSAASFGAWTGFYDYDEVGPSSNDYGEITGYMTGLRAGATGFGNGTLTLRTMARFDDGSGPAINGYVTANLSITSSDTLASIITKINGTGKYTAELTSNGSLNIYLSAVNYTPSTAGITVTDSSSFADKTGLVKPTIHLPNSSYTTVTGTGSASKLTEAEAIAQGYTVIKTAQQLQNINNNLSGKYILMGDIDLSGIANFTPIGRGDAYGYAEQPFTGTFDGNGYVISNLTIDTSSAYESGLFGVTVGATIKNVGLENVYINNTLNSYTRVGGLVGYANGTTISNSYVKGSVKSNGDSSPNGVGMLVGYMNGGTVEKSYAQGNVTNTGGGISGGLIGFASQGTVKNSYSNAVVDCTSSNSRAGGFIGYLDGGSLSNCYSDGKATINGSSAWATLGVFVGVVDGNVLSNGLYWNRDKGPGVANSLSNIVLTGLTTAQMGQSSNFSGWNTGVWDFSGAAPTLKNMPTASPSGTVGTGSITGAKVEGMTGSTNFAGLKDGKITFKYKKFDGTEASASINVSSTDTVDDVLSKIANATVDGTEPGQPYHGFGFNVENGQIKIDPRVSKLLSIESDTSGFTQFAGLSTTGLNQKENSTSGVKSDTTALLGSVSGLTESSILGVNAAGSYTLKLQNGSDFTFTISSTDTIKDIINKIDASGTFTAGLDAQGKFFIQGKIVNSSGGGSATSTALSGNRQVSGTSVVGKTTMTFGVNGTEYSVSTTSASATMNDIIGLINAKTAQSGIKAAIQNGKFTLSRVENGSAAINSGISLKISEGNLGLLTGLSDFTSAGPTKTNLPDRTQIIWADSNLGQAALNKQTLLYSVNSLTESEAIAQGYTLIKSESDFYLLNTNSSGKFILMNDISLSGFNGSIITNTFNGELNGNGYMLSASFDVDGVSGAPSISIFKELGASSNVHDLSVDASYGVDVSRITSSTTTMMVAALAAKSAGNIFNVASVTAVTLFTSNGLPSSSGVLQIIGGGLVGAQQSGTIDSANSYFQLRDSTTVTGINNYVKSGLVGAIAASCGTNTNEAAVIKNSTGSVNVQSNMGRMTGITQTGSVLNGFVGSKTAYSTCDSSNNYLAEFNYADNSGAMAKLPWGSESFTPAYSKKFIAGVEITGSTKNATSLNSLMSSGFFNGYIDISNNGSSFAHINIDSSSTIESILSQVNATSFLSASFNSEGQIVIAGKNGFDMSNVTFGGTSSLAVAVGLKAGTIAADSTYIKGSSGSGGGSTGPVGPNEIVGTKDVSSTHLTEAEAVAQGYTVIKTASQLQNIKNNLTGKFILMGDIDLSSLGTLSNSLVTGTFTGTFNGNGYSLSNLEIDSSANNVGLFSETNGASISNLNLVNANVSGARYVGGIVGKATNNTNISNVNVIGGNIGNSSACNTGGIVGDMLDSTVFMSSVQGTSINGYDGVGGIAGSGNGSINNSYATASVSGWARVGGIIGLMGGTSISSVNSSYFDGTVTGTERFGGIAGSLVGSASVSNSSYWNKTKVTNGVGNALESSVFSGMGLTSSQMNGETMKPGLGDLWDYSSGFTPKLKQLSGSGINVSAGTIVVNGQTINLSAGSIDSALAKINEKTSVTGVVASIENSKLVFRNAQGVTTGVSVQEGTSDIYKKAGLSGSSFTKMTEAQAKAQGYTVVKTADEFIAAVRSSSNSKIVLMNDIDLAGADLSRGLWLDDKVLDGNGFVLKNVTRDSSMADGFGIFEYINNSTVKNLGLSNIDISNSRPSSSPSNMGILAGSSTSSSFENIYIENSSVNLGSPDGNSSSGNYLGGLIGKATDVKVDNVMLYNSNVGILHSMYSGNTGGLIGNLAGTSNSISNVSIVDSTISITGGPSGGLVGRFNDNSTTATLRDIYIDGITFKDDYAEGHGYAPHSSNGILSGIMPSGNPINVSNIKYVSSEASKLFGTQTYTTSSPEVTGYANSSALQQAFKNSTSSSFENSTSGKAIQKSLANVLGSKMSSDLGVNVRPSYSGSGSLGDTSSVGKLTEAEAIAQGYTVIKTAQGLLDINKNPTGKYILMNDIDLSSLGTQTDSIIVATFGGTLDGNGYSIKNLKIDSAANGVGLFKEISGTVRNLKIENANVKGEDDVGALVGRTIGNARISDVQVVNADLTGVTNVGGLVGSTSAGTTIDRSSTSGKIYASYSYAGGLVGNNRGIIQLSSSSAAVGNFVTALKYVNGEYLGGLVGSNSGSISDSYSTGAVRGDGFIGGFVGVNSGTIDKSYSSGSVVAKTFIVGGFVGHMSSGSMANSFYDTQKSGQATAGGGITSLINVKGLTTAEMGASTEFTSAGWDATYWDFSGSSPTLKSAATPPAGGDSSGGSGSTGGVTIVSNGSGQFDKMTGLNEYIVNGSLSETLGSNGKMTVTGATKDMQLSQVLGGLTSGKFSITQGGVSVDIDVASTDTVQNLIDKVNATGKFTATLNSQGQLEIAATSSVSSSVQKLTEAQAIAQGYTVIKTAQDLQNINNNLSGKYMLMGDIDMSGVTNWTSIGFNAENVFTGIFDGNGFKIKNYTASATGVDNSGSLFGAIQNAEIKNLGLVDINITSEGAAGGLVGAAASSKISNCYTTGTIKGTGSYSSNSSIGYGGIAGGALYNTVIESSYSSVNIVTTGSGDVSSSISVGGVVGLLSVNSSVSNTYFSGTINNSGNYIDSGGIAGFTHSSSISNSYVSGTVNGSGSNSDLGAIIGFGSTDSSISNSFWDTSKIGGASAAANAFSNESAFVNAGWDSNVWDFSGAKPTLKETYGSSVTSGGSGESITFGGSSNASELLGFKSTVANGATQVTGTADKRSTLTGSAAVTENMTFSSGNFILSLGSKSQEFTTYDGETLTSVMNKINTSSLGVSASIQDGKLVFTSKDSSSDLISLKDGTSNFAELTGFIGSGGGQAVTAVKGVLSTYTSVNTANNAQNQGFSAGTFFVHLTDNDGNITGTKEITIGKNEDINSIIGKINGSGLGVTASINDSGKMVITRNSSATAGGVLVTKGSSDFTHKIGYTSGGGQSAVTRDGTSASITSSNSISNSARFTSGDFTIRMTGENAADINIQIAATDSIQMIIDKINAKGAGITASLDSNNKLVLTRDANKGDGAIEVIKGSSNFTNVAGFTNGGYQTASTVEGVTASIKSVSSASSSTRFSAGNFVISLTGDNAKDVSIDITASDSIYDIVDKINASGAGVTAYIDSNKKMVITRDAGTGEGSIEIKKGTSDFTKVMGFTTGGDDNGVFAGGTTSTITSKTSANTAMATGYHSGDFFIKLTDKNGAVQKTITVNVGNTGTNGAVDNIAKIIESINSQNAGVTASLDSNGKLVLKRDESQGAGSLIVEKGTSDFTNVIGLTDGGNFNGTAEDGVAATHTVLTSNRLAVSNRATLASLGITNGSFSINGVEIAVRATDTIDDVIGKINSTFSDPKYKDIGVTAEFKNNQIVLTSKKASANSRIEIESGSTNFTQVVGLTDTVSRGNAVDLGQNAKFNIKLGNDLIGKDFDLALDLKDITNDGIYNGNNLIYLDVNGKVVMEANNAAITIEIKKTGETVIKLGQNLLDASINELNKFVGSFNKAMIASENEILSDDAEFTKFINKIKSAMTSDVADIRKITQQLAKIGITVDIRGGTDSNMGTVRLSVDREAYSKAFYEDSQNVMNLLVGKDTAVGMADGVLTRLNNVLYPEVKNNSGYFNKTPRQLEAVQKELKREITSTTFDLNELKNAVAGDGINTGVADYLSQLEQQYQLIQDAINNLNKQYSTSMMRLVLNKNNSSFNPMVS